jgi:hypothetical protein
VAQRQMSRIAPRNFPGADIGPYVVSEEEKTDNSRDGRKPSAPRFPWDESCSKADDATDPENLAGNQH